MHTMMTSEGAAELTAWSTVGLVLVGLVAAIAAVRQLRMISRDSRARTRPYVQVDLVPGLQGAGSWDLIIENRGASTAHDVTIDAGEFHAQDDDDHIIGPLKAYLASPRTLVPGARRRLMWGYALAERDIRAGILEECQVKVSYRDDSTVSRGRAGQLFEDRFTLEDVTSAAAGIYPAPTEGAVTGDPLKNINLAVRALGSHVGELRR